MSFTVEGLYWLLLRGGRYKASHALRPFYDLLCVPIGVVIILDSCTRALWQIPEETPSSEMSVNFAGEVSLSYSAGIFNMP
jgi:hypothetical protein